MKRTVFDPKRDRMLFSRNVPFFDAILRNGKILIVFSGYDDLWML